MSAHGIAHSVVQVREIPRFVTFDRPNYDAAAIVPAHVVAVVKGSHYDDRPTSIVVTTVGEYRVFGDMGQVINRLNGAE